MSASISSFCYYSIILAQSRTMEDTTASLANKSARRRAQRADYRQQQKSARLAAKEAASKDSEFTASEQGRLKELERGMRLISSAGSSKLPSREPAAPDRPTALDPSNVPHKYGTPWRSTSLPYCQVRGHRSSRYRARPPRNTTACLFLGPRSLQLQSSLRTFSPGSRSASRTIGTPCALMVQRSRVQPRRLCQLQLQMRAQ